MTKRVKLSDVNKRWRSQVKFVNDIFKGQQLKKIAENLDPVKKEKAEAKFLKEQKKIEDEKSANENSKEKTVYRGKKCQVNCVHSQIKRIPHCYSGPWQLSSTSCPLSKNRALAATAAMIGGTLGHFATFARCFVNFWKTHHVVVRFNLSLDLIRTDNLEAIFPCFYTCVSSFRLTSLRW